MKQSSKLVFFGNERLATGVNTAAPTLKSLVESGYDVQSVVSSFVEGTSRNARRLEMADIAKSLEIPLLLPKKLTEIKDELKDMGAQAGILVAYGRIIPEEIIDIFPSGIINIHPSLLPKYRGSTPIETVILDGASQTGVSLMRLAPKMDAGPVYAQKSTALNGRETKQELADKLLKSGGDLLLQHLPAILDGSAQPTKQAESDATYTNRLSKIDGLVRWEESAEVIERKIRAYLVFPKTHTKIFGTDVIITKARVARETEDGDLVMKCQPGYLEILELVGPSGLTISGADFLRGYAKN